MSADIGDVRRRLGLDSAAAGPKAVRSLLARRSPLSPAPHQRRILSELPLEDADFSARLERDGFAPFQPAQLEIFQINVGKLCNMTCRHCHVDAGPDRVNENMDREMIDRCLAALDQTTAHTVDITGGAPELNPNFRYLVDQCVARGKHVIDRCNLTILMLSRFSDLPEWFAARGVEVVASLPHHRARNTDAQRGDGTFGRSIAAIQKLNAAGYGKGDPKRTLTLMHNPAGAFLPAGQASMERQWKRSLERTHGITFDRLIALNNMPISRFLEWLLASDNLQGYMETLVNAYNPAAVSGMMCRNTLSVGWDGTLYDCDFNQMLELPVDVSRPNIQDFDLSALQARTIRTERHCFGCSAGAGSSCGGATT
ncbi:MAG: arsenosugar biosynthesis radical SAM (seleno)protein ArsS [Myxococcota bacterium]